MYVKSIYQYGSLLYGTASKSHLGALQRQQNYLVRIILGLKRTDEVRTLENIPFSQYLSFMYTNCLNYFVEYFAESIIVHLLTTSYLLLKLIDVFMIRENPNH